MIRKFFSLDWNINKKWLREHLSVFKSEPTTFIEMVAGAGFEPTTFGL
jgi:hypothetical protein